MALFRFVGTGSLIAKAKAGVADAMPQIGEDLVHQSQSGSPVDTGTLKASIHVQSATTTDVTVATGGESNEYAIYVHEGTSKMAGRPFMTQALLNNASLYTEILQRAVRGQF